MKYESIDPTTGQRIEGFPFAAAGEVREALAAADAAAAGWRTTPLETRVAHVSRTAELLDAQAGELAELMTEEMGKRLEEGRAEAGKCAWACRWYAEHAATLLESEERDSDGSEARIRYEPLGPILAIMPWNFPFWQFFRFAVPALVAGNVVLLKHAPNTPRCALRIERLLLEAGLPAGVVQNLFLTHEQAAGVMSDRRVRGVTFTGSTRGGKQVAAQGGAHLKKMVMELGGADAFIVLDDADVTRAVETGVAARCLNNGQSCIAAKRFVLQKSVYDEFRDGLVTRMRAMRLGDPRDPEVQLGPLARRDLREKLADQVERSIVAGARALCGGATPEGDGFFYPATVLVDAPADSPAATEELFGPVATLFRVDTEDDAIRLANATDYGLGTSLWSADRERADRLVPRIESGAVFVNGMVKSDPRLPFGGIKDSGFGRELGREGLLEFVNRKTVWIGG